MPRLVHKRLSALKVASLREPGTYADGQGLYLVIGAGGARSWFFRYVSNGRAREMGIGPERDVSLAEARERASEFRRQRRDGIDPADSRKAQKAERKLERARGITFRQSAERFIEANKAGWKNAKHAAQWTATLETYAHPTIGEKAVTDVGVADVLAILNPIWTTKSETATRVRGRIESVLDFAKANGWRTGENPAAWRGHLQRILPPKARVSTVTHHAAMAYSDLPPFVRQLRAASGIAARALEFTILTAARTGEVIGATWPEIDTKARVWTIPGERMKAKREHRVPLSNPATAILDEMAALGAIGFVFPGGRAGKPLSNMGMDAVLRRMEVPATVHGFRSSFRDWAGNETNFARELAEAALSHVIGDKAEQAYRRSDALNKRRALMDAWASFCLETGDKTDV